MSEEHNVEIYLKQVMHIDCNKCKVGIDVSECEPFDLIECPECGTELPIPGMIGEYVLFKELGTGRVGTVFQGFDQTLLRHVALKVMNRRFREDADFVAGFMTQARAMASLNHDNIVKVYTCGNEEEQPYVVMELIEGGRLSDRIKAGVPMDEMTVMKIGRDIVNGLSAAHEVGMLHGDVKPENILMDKKGTAKIMDFSVVPTEDSGEIWGTPNYMAPEKARGQEEDQRSDFYSLGATLFHALAGEPPFVGETPKEVILARLQEPAPLLSEYRDDLNPGTVKLIARMLETEPMRRYPNDQSLLADFGKVLQESKSLAQKNKPKTAAQPAVRKKPKAGVIILMILLACWIGAFAYALVQSNKKDQPLGDYIVESFSDMFGKGNVKPKKSDPEKKGRPAVKLPDDDKPKRMSFDEIEAEIKRKKKANK